MAGKRLRTVRSPNADDNSILPGRCSGRNMMRKNQSGSNADDQGRQLGRKRDEQDF